MSSEIYYDRAFILVGEQYIPIVSQGSSNCFELNEFGREVPERYWSVMNYPQRDKFIFSAEELHKVAADYDAISVSSGGGIRKTRYTAFIEGEFARWILGGMRSAHTVEEYTEYGNTVVVVDRSTYPWSRIPVSTTEQLLETLDKQKGKSADVAFLNRYISRPPMRSQRKPYDFSEASEYYILKAPQGFFVKLSRRHIWFLSPSDESLSGIRKFKSVADAQRYLRKNEGKLSKYDFEIVCVKNHGKGRSA